MEECVCTVCGYAYDPEQGDPDSGIEPGTAFKDIGETWVCPVCGATKDQFEPKQLKKIIDTCWRDLVASLTCSQTNKFIL